VLGWAERVLLGLATLALVVMMFVISFDALGRYLFDSPFKGSFEITSLFLMVMVVFATLSYNYGAKKHVRLDLFTSRLEERLGSHYPRIVGLICLPCFSFLAYLGIDELLHKWVSGEQQAGLPLPVALSYGWVTLGAITLSLRLLLDIVSPADQPEHDESPSGTLK